MDRIKEVSTNNRCKPLPTKALSLSLSLSQQSRAKPIPSFDLDLTRRAHPFPLSFHTFSPYCCIIIVLPLLLFFFFFPSAAAAAMGFGNRRHAMRANGNGYMAQIRVRLGAAAINMIIPLEEGKESGYTLHIRPDDSDKGKVKLPGFRNGVKK